MSGSGVSWAICKSAPRSRQITTPAPHRTVFTGRCPSCHPTNSVKALKAKGGCCITAAVFSAWLMSTTGAWTSSSCHHWQTDALLPPSPSPSSRYYAATPGTRLLQVLICSRYYIRCYSFPQRRSFLLTSLLFFFKSLTALYLHVSESGVFFLAFGHLRMNTINLQDRTVIISEKKLTMTVIRQT